MVRLREIPRTAAFTWSPGTGSPLLATGTRAGAVDADFSSDTQLELWDLALNDTTQDSELQPIASIGTDSRFHDIAWVQPKDGYERGVIAGALENGSLDLWDAKNLINGISEPFMSRTSKHSGAIKTLQFNPFRHELLATAGAKGELFISDFNNIGNPFRLGNTAARADDFECLDWNKKVPHIMVTGSSGGFVTVWDVKSKKESLTLNNYGRKAVSAVAWDPEKPTRLITAVPLDTDPLILVWDLRNSNAPEKILHGHEGGVLSLSWCPQDSDLLLSCGKDNRTICWNPQTGEPYGEFPVVTNWTFQTRWNPHNPNFLATASFDGKIAVQTVQNTKAETVHTAGAQALDGEDFFNKAQSQPQSSSFSLSKTPKWMERPNGVSFGFGGKIVNFGPFESDGSGLRRSKIKISSFAVDTEIEAMTETFAKAIAEKDLSGVCQSRVSSARSETEKTDWKVIETLTAENPRKELVNYLGFTSSPDEAADDFARLGLNEDTDGTNNLSVSEAKGVSPASNNRLSAFFETGSDGDNFLAELASTKGAKTNNPFHIYSDSEPEADRKITQALMLGQFDKAMEICLKEDRLSDAFMIAICGGQSSIDKVQKAYFKKQASGPKYLRLLASVVGKNLWDVVYNANLENWKEVMATLCTYARAEEFPDLCEALGDRLDEQSTQEAADSSLRKNAAFCYIAGSKLEKVVLVWIAELERNENESLRRETSDSTFSIHARSLQAFIEKVTIFREVTHYQDKERLATGGWKLDPLYDKYIEYADVVASHGQLHIAEKYLDLLPDKYPTAEVARNRVKQATKKTIPQQVAQQATTSQTKARQVQKVPTFEEQRQTGFNQTTGPYAPQIVSQPQGQYTPQQSVGPYGAPSYQTSQPPPGRHIIPPPPSFGAPAQLPGRTVSPAVQPPSKAANMPNWNDTPEDFFKPPTSRRGTPAVQPSTISAPFSNQPMTMSTPPMTNQPFNAPPKASQAPPPPRGPAPPQRTMTPQMNQGHQQTERPSSSATNMYAPPPSNMQAQQQPQIPRGPSPYNAPPSGQSRDVSNRYAPAPVSQQATPPSQHQTRPPPPPNPFASRQSFSGPRDAMSGPGGPPQGPPQVPLQGPPPTTQAPAQQRKPPRPETPKHPPGDRSHIPAHAQPVFDILNEDMQRVKSKAPASYKVQVNDTEKRLNILFDHLNNETLLKSNTIQDMIELAQAMRSKDYERARVIHLDIMTNRTEECTNWMTGVKRLIGMSSATP